MQKNTTIDDNAWGATMLLTCEYYWPYALTAVLTYMFEVVWASCDYFVVHQASALNYTIQN